MPTLHVCPLSRLGGTVEATGASHIVSLINADTPVPRPAAILAERHLFIGMHDIIDPLEGCTLPCEEHVESLVAFVREWDRERPLIIHCYAGISRSTAAAFIAACALRPDADEAVMAQRLRRASPTALPNSRLVACGDIVLGRGGRMPKAIASIGYGAPAMEGEPFSLPFD